jgi:hypothetical protein
MASNSTTDAAPRRIKRIEEMDFLESFAEKVVQLGEWLHQAQVEGRISEEDELRLLAKLRDMFTSY